MSPSPSTHGADGRRERWSGHRQQRRAEFVAAGAAAVERQGTAVSAEDVAAEAGVSRSVLYRYFKDKDDLQSAIAQHIVEQLIDEVSPSILSGSTAHDIITNTVGTMVDWVGGHPRLYLFLRERRAAGSVELSALESVEATVAGQLTVLLAAFMRWFGVSAAPAELGAHAIVGLVETSITWWIRTSSVTRDELVIVLTRSVWAVITSELDVAGVQLGLYDPLPLEALADASLDDPSADAAARDELVETP